MEGASSPSWYYTVHSCRLSTVNVETCLWLPVLLESTLWRQLQGHDPGSAPASGQNETPCYQTVEAADWSPHHSKLPGRVPCICIPKKPTFFKDTLVTTWTSTHWSWPNKESFCYNPVSCFFNTDVTSLFPLWLCLNPFQDLHGPALSPVTSPGENVVTVI